MLKQRSIIRALIFALTILSLVSVGALAAPITGTFTGLGPYAKINGTFNGSSVSYNGGTMKLTIDGVTVGSFCTDLKHGIASGDTLVSTDAQMDCRITWMLLNYPPLLSGDAYPDSPPTTPLSDKNKEMAARQAAVWYFSDGFLPKTADTVGDRAWAIINSVPQDACAALEADTPTLSVVPSNSVKTLGDNTETFTVTATRGGSPISGLTINGSTDFGSLGSSTATTDANGQAFFTLTNISGTVGTANFTASATVDLPVGTIFQGSPNAEKQKLVLGKMTPGSIFDSASVTWQNPGSIVTHVYHDRNMNGTVDTSEAAVQGWTVTLYRWDGSGWVSQSTQTTNASGLATFSGLAAGQYRVDETVQSGWLATTPASVTVDVDANTASVEFGVIRTPVVIAAKFDDANLNGAQDTGEADLPGWTMTLYRADGSAVLGATGVTGDDGAVVLTFDRASDFVPGTYFVRETQQPLWFVTTGGLSQSFTLSGNDLVTVVFGNALAQPALTLTKSAPAYAHVGDTLTINYTVQNTGNVALNNVTVSDPLLGGSLADCARSTLAVGESYTCSATYTVLSGDPDPLGSTATASGTDAFGQSASDTDSASTDIVHPAISVSVSAPVSVTVGSLVEYAITVHNTGDVDLSNVSVTDSVTGFSWTGALAAGSSQSFNASYTAQPGDTGTLVNTVTATGQDAYGGSVSDTDSASTLVVLGDSDGDGIPDVDEGGGDSDGDGTPNYHDADSDGDGILDTVEGDGDADGDGLPNYLDADSDGDGISDAIETANDADGDGLPNYLDADSDGDGISDAIETANDADGDGIPNFLDADSDGDGIPDATETANDRDGDGLPNFLDTDSDGDGIPDASETANDRDGDGTPNFLDFDSDNDGISDAGEYSTGPSDRLTGCTSSSPVCTDNDADDDGLPNYLDSDSDGDGIPDNVEGTGDSDGDGIPDYLDTVDNSPRRYTLFMPLVSRNP